MPNQCCTQIPKYKYNKCIGSRYAMKLMESQHVSPLACSVLSKGVEEMYPRTRRRRMQDSIQIDLACLIAFGKFNACQSLKESINSQSKPSCTAASTKDCSRVVNMALYDVSRRYFLQAGTCSSPPRTRPKPLVVELGRPYFTSGCSGVVVDASATDNTHLNAGCYLINSPADAFFLVAGLERRRVRRFFHIIWFLSLGSFGVVGVGSHDDDLLLHLPLHLLLSPA